MKKLPDKFGHFGKFGGAFVPDTLYAAITELDKVYRKLKRTPKFQKELKGYLTNYVGRPSPLTYAKRISGEVGYHVYLKREDLNHTGAHKINNTLGQVLLAKHMGKTRIIAETGAGQHGVATATVCALMDLECVIYMGSEDMKRQALNVYRMEFLGAKVIPVNSGSKTLKDATTEAIRDWLTTVENTHYIIGSVLGPHPFPMIVRDFQSVIGQEARKQIMRERKRLPNHVVACVGGGSNAMGIFYPFLKDKKVKLTAVEAAGHGLNTTQFSAALTKGVPGILHGSLNYVLQDENGQIQLAHSIAAGLDYPGVSPELSYLLDEGRIEVTSVTDKQALEACKWFSRMEGIIPALETSHAIAFLKKNKVIKPKEVVILCVSGRGDKDMETLKKHGL
ncbi:MAG: tryptophan synthase beta chain [Candidatus Marinamargulisbacteria bacterium]|jgi:tryptophan synthase beta chain